MYIVHVHLDGCMYVRTCVCMYRDMYITTYGYILTLTRHCSIGMYPVVPVMYRYNYHTLLFSLRGGKLGKNERSDNLVHH